MQSHPKMKLTSLITRDHHLKQIKSHPHSTVVPTEYNLFDVMQDCVCNRQQSFLIIQTLGCGGNGRTDRGKNVFAHQESWPHAFPNYLDLKGLLHLPYLSPVSEYELVQKIIFKSIQMFKHITIWCVQQGTLKPHKMQWYTTIMPRASSKITFD